MVALADAWSPGDVRARSVWRFALASSALFVPLAARAAEPARFRYLAPPECPTKGEFLERVRERSVHERPATPDELALNFDVTLSTDAAGALGRVEFVDNDGTPVSRAVHGATCDEVASGIALVTALAIDARAGAEPAAETAPRATPSATPARPAPAPVTVKTAPAAARAVAPRGFFTAGAGGGFQSFFGPSGGGSLDAFFGATSPRGKSLRLSAWYWLGSGSEGGRAADFRAWGGRLDACPWAFTAQSFFFTPCLGLDLGLLRAEGVRGAALPAPEHASVFWRDVALVARAGAVLGGRVVLEAQGDLVVPLFRHDFGFTQPAGQLYSVPAVGAGVSLHASVRFP